jgi:hypothetical protein
MEETGNDGAKVLLWAVVGLGAVYLLSKLMGSISGGIASVTAPAANALAQWYVQLTSSGQAIPQGFVLFPDGSSVSLATVNVSSIANPASPAGISGIFQLNGQTWYLNSSHDTNGNYVASTQLGYP